MKENKQVTRESTMHTEVKPRKPRAGLGREVQTKIGQQLRAMYDEVVSQGVPDRFTELLRQLDVGGPEPAGTEPGRATATPGLAGDDKESR